ncbi:MAG: O-antigen ligase family protein, partial [Gemmatimonadetes bacterium]|nr:O-antigen ligase family protein [Gemmatimonadota bacterium]
MDNRMRGRSSRPSSWAGARPRHPRQVAVERAAAALFRRAEAAFAVAGIFLFSGALLPLLLEQRGADLGPEEGNIVLRSVFASIDAISLLLVGVHWRAAAAAISRHKATLALVGLALLSVIWSAAPDLTLRRSFAFLGSTAFGVYIAARYDTRTLLKLLASALGLAGVLSVLFAVGLPSYGIDHGVHAGAWQGIYPHKNNLAQIMVLSTIAFLLLRPTLTRGRMLATSGAALSIGLILLSTSKTAAGVLVMMLVLLPLLRTLRWKYTLALPVLIGCALLGGAVGMVLLANSEAVLTTIGKDPTLTGRTPMWMAIFDVIADQPWLGYGYSAFWL